MSYASLIHEIITTKERAIFRACSSPVRIQNYLDTLKINFEISGETYMSPRRVFESGSAHCFEGALVAAAALAYHGSKPLLMDFKTRPSDTDHVVALYKLNGFWGAISKTNRPILKWRDPVYKSPRELAMSYFHEYYLWDGTKSLISYSDPFDLSRYQPGDWITCQTDLDDLALDLDKSKHHSCVPAINRRNLRKSSKIELKALRLVEWQEPKKYSGGT